MDIQVLLLVILLLLTINLIVVGVYIIAVLKDFRKVVSRLNSVLETVQGVTEKVSFPVMSLTGIMAGLTSGIKFLDAIKGKKKDSEEE